jgi:hypothetical protein
MRSALVAAGLVWIACVEQGPGPGPKKVDPEYVKKHLLAEVPADGLTRLDVSLGGKVVYVGNTIDPPAAVPGQKVQVTHYWRVVQPVGIGWRVFALLRGAPHSADFMNLSATDMQIAHGPARWKAGEVIKDVQDITLRPDWRSPTATLYVGLIASGGHGFADRMAASGPGTEDRAVVARVIDVDLSRAPPPPGTVYVPRAKQPITIDGAASAQEWAAAAVALELATAEGSGEPVGKASAKLTWDDQFLYAFVSIADTDVWSEYKNHDDPMWTQDCVELFIDADGNRRGYIELQVNPNNATFDAWFATTRPHLDKSWESGIQTAVAVRGTPARGDVDQGWDAEIAIPWQAVRGRDEAMAVKLPPQVGDRWRLNLVRVDVKSGDKNPTASSWNKITVSDFHALDRMLTVVFADETGVIAPRPPGSSAAPSPAAPSPAAPSPAAPSPAAPSPATPSPAAPAATPAPSRGSATGSAK